jgi:hypothetical protein
MGILYILTLIVLGISFMIFKKSEEKLNFIKWLIIFLVSILGYNIVLGMILGLLNITSHLLLLSLINLVFSGLLGYKAIKNKEFQKYFVRKIDIVGIIVVLAIFTVMFIKDLYIYKGDISHGAVDSAIHYRAAKHYADNLKIFVNVEDKTFFNFNVMQTGAYINDGIFMNVLHRITGIEYCYLYQAFETMVLFLSGLAFYATFIDKIKTKRGLVLSLMIFGLYMYGYPYNSWIYGFSYLSVGIAMVAMLLAVVEELYSKVNKILVISLIGMLATGLIFSYCLFVPAIFAAICIYVFLKDLSNKEEKKYLKFFGKTTLIVTAMLVVITIAGIGYLFIPTFFIEGQTDLVTALKIDGAIYSEKYQNFIAYVPFAIMYCFEIVRRIRKKDLRYFDVFSILMIGYFSVLFLGLRYGKVSLYYMFKFYYVTWIVILGVTIDLINQYIDLKILKWIIPIYVTVWTLFVCGWVWVKAGHIIGEEEKHALKNYVGMYYSENCEFRKLIDLTQNLNSNEIKVISYARENLEDMSVDNTILMTTGYFTRIWSVATLELSSPNYKYEKVVQDTHNYKIEDATDDSEKKYIIKLVSYDQTELDAYAELLKEVEDRNDVNILYENENGFVAEVVRQD